MRIKACYCQYWDVSNYEMIYITLYNRVNALKRQLQSYMHLSVQEDT
jgi:hypothetical protein